MTQNKAKSIGETRREACAALPSEDVDALLRHALGETATWIFLHADDPMPEVAAESFDAMLRRRMAGEPVAYIEGTRGFWTLDLQVSPATLIPRPETELLVSLALASLPANEHVEVLDLGTGSGAIALAIARERPQARVTAVDASDAALVVAKQNAERNAIANVQFLAGDWFAPVAGQSFHCIVSNPPYIADKDPHLSQGDLRFEPHGALASGTDGLDDIRRIVATAPSHLLPGAALLIEHGYDQGAVVHALFTAAGFEAIETLQDLEHRDRVTRGLKSAA